jgi:hypothetical protein
MNIREKMEKLKKGHSNLQIKIAINDCIEIFDNGLPTDSEFYNKCIDIASKENGAITIKDFPYSLATRCARHFGLLRKEPVKRWKWTDGIVTSDLHYTWEEFCNKSGVTVTSENWHKVDGSEVCE